ncbi:unnamed protein product [Parajaminaea phylloscopi]
MNPANEATPTSSSALFDADAEQDACSRPSVERYSRHRRQSSSSSSSSSRLSPSALAPSWLRRPFKEWHGYSQVPSSASSRGQPAIQRLVSAVVVPFYSVALVVTLALSLLQPSSTKNNGAGVIYVAQTTAPSNWSALDLGPPLPRNVQEDISLSAEACQAEFPAFYDQLRANAHAWASRGGLTQDHVRRAWDKCEGGCAHVLLSDGHVYIRALNHDWQSRVRAVLSLLVAAVEATPPGQRAALDGTEFVFSTADKDGTHDDDGAGWVLDKRVTDPAAQYLIPDFSFAAWPEAGIASYAEFRRDAEAVNSRLSWSHKKNKVFWRGDPTVGNAARQSLMEQIKTDRSASSWADIKRTSFWEPDFAPIVLPADHCAHKYLLHSEGNAYSGRSKFILGCSSAVVMHKQEWTQHFHPALITQPRHPDNNVIENPGQLFEGLGELMQSLQASDRQAHARGAVSEGQRVAINANRTLTQRYLTPAATACYLRAALASYNSILDRKSWRSPPSLSSSSPGSRPFTAAGPLLVAGGGVKPGAGAGEFKGPKLKELHLQGDIAYTTWIALGQPEWPPK